MDLNHDIECPPGEHEQQPCPSQPWIYSVVLDECRKADTTPPCHCQWGSNDNKTRTSVPAPYPSQDLIYIP